MHKADVDMKDFQHSAAFVAESEHPVKPSGHLVCQLGFVIK